MIRVEAHQRVELGEAAGSRQKIAERCERQRADHDLELVLALPGLAAKRGAIAERRRRTFAQPSAQIFRNLEPRPLELLDLHRQPEIVRERGLQAIRRSRLQRQRPGARELRVVRHRITIARVCRCNAYQRARERRKPVTARAIEVGGRIGIGPRAIEQRDEPMLEHVEEVDERRVFALAPPFIRGFREMQRQRAIRSEEAETVLFEAEPALPRRSERDNVWRCEGEMRRVTQAHGIIGRLARLPTRGRSGNACSSTRNAANSVNACGSA